VHQVGNEPRLDCGNVGISQSLLQWVPRMLTQELTFLTGAQYSHLQTVTIPEAAYIQLRRRPPEDEQGNARNM
jgi:hypothetical protein